jgi:hypothetical protein
MNEWGCRCVEFDMNDASKAARESRFSETELWFIRHPGRATDDETPRTSPGVEAAVAPVVVADPSPAAKSATTPAHDSLLP